MKKIIFLLLIISIYSCGSQWRAKQDAKHCSKCPTVTNTITRDSLITVVKDSTISIPADSAWYRAWIQCKDNVPYIVTQESGNTQGISINTHFNNGALSVECKIDSAQVVLRWNETHNTHSNIQSTITQKPPVTIFKTHWYIYSLMPILLILGFILGFNFANFWKWVKSLFI